MVIDWGPIQSAITAGAGLGGVWLGGRLTEQREEARESAREMKEATYLAILVAAHLDRFANVCLRVAFDGGTEEALNKTGEVQVPSRRSTLIGSYSLLDADAATVARKPNEEEALQLMSDYYRANKDRLPADIRLHRNAIVELIVAGVSAQNAFSAVLRSEKLGVN